MADFAEGQPTAVVPLDKPRTIGFSLGAMRRVRDQLGTLEYDPDSPDALLALPAYVWACLSSADRAELSVAQVEDMIHPGNMAEVSETLGVILRASSPDAKPTVAGPAKPGR